VTGSVPPSTPSGGDSFVGPVAVGATNGEHDPSTPTSARVSDSTPTANTPAVSAALTSSSPTTSLAGAESVATMPGALSSMMAVGVTVSVEVLGHDALAVAGTAVNDLGTSDGNGINEDSELIDDSQSLIDQSRDSLPTRGDDAVASSDRNGWFDESDSGMATPASLFARGADLLASCSPFSREAIGKVVDSILNELDEANIAFHDIADRFFVVAGVTATAALAVAANQRLRHSKGAIREEAEIEDLSAYPTLPSRRQRLALEER
jgi:hypothetical protein